MLGLIKKDLYLILNNRNAIIIYLIMVGFFAVFAKMDISYILPFFFLSIFLSTFSYDEYNNFNGYVCTMPKGREYVVLSKYLLTIIISLILSVFPLLLNILAFKTSFEESLTIALGSLFGFYLIVSVIYPLMFKFGAEKGRIAMIGCFFAVVVICYLLLTFIDLDNNILSGINSTTVIIIIVSITILMLTISYFISKNIYRNKQF